MKDFINSILIFIVLIVTINVSNHFNGVLVTFIITSYVVISFMCLLFELDKELCSEIPKFKSITDNV